MMEVEVKHPASQAVVFRTDALGHLSVLLIKRADVGVWTIPGGKREINESAEQAAVRETKEETGYDISIVRQLGRYQLIGSQVVGRAIVFVGQVVGGNAKISAETAAVRWTDVLRLPFTLLPFHRERIIHAIQGKENLTIVQDYPRRKVLLHYLLTPWIALRLIVFYRKKELMRP